MLYLPRIEESDFGVPPKAFLLLPHYQWRTWDKIGLSSFPVFHNKLAVELGLESRSPNLGEFSISSDHVRLSSSFTRSSWHDTCHQSYFITDVLRVEQMVSSLHPPSPWLQRVRSCQKWHSQPSFPRGPPPRLLILFVCSSFLCSSKHCFMVPFSY